MEEYIQELLENGFILKSNSEFDIIKYRDHYFKLHKRNEAYIAISIKTADIIAAPAEKIARDRLGHELLALRSGAINLDNIDRFMHVSGQYAFNASKLVHTGDYAARDQASGVSSLTPDT